MPKLFDDDEYDSDVEFKTNTDYVAHYNTWRQKEELNRLKTKYGDVALNDEPGTDESSSSDEDEVGVQLTEEFEKDFFKTLACLKTKDPRIYDHNTKFFNDDLKYFKKSEISKEKKKDPLLLSNYEKKMVSRTGGRFEDEDDDNESDKEREDPRSNSPTYVEEQRKLKESLKNALEIDDGENEENWGGMFKKRVILEEEAKQEEDEYSEWLKGHKNELTDKQIENELEPLKDYWNNPKLDKEEAFLRDYLLNKRYMEKETDDYIPTYDEIIHDSDEGLSEDEKNIDKQEEFENKYNFRFEEPDEEYIKRYPRTMANSVRQKDDRRKLKRAEIKERKEEDKKRKQEDLKQLKALKKKEIEERINKLKEITGNDDLTFQDDDLEGDFDPDEYDKRMQKIFNDEYYAGEEGDQKPEFDDLEEELGPWVHDNEPHCEDDNFIMDCDFDPNVASTSKESKKKKRNRYDKKGNKIEKIEFDENDPRFEKYTDELYQLDYEDMIGDIPCRFKYREVVPNDFGLSIEEILIAKDRELNRWCSLKKAVQHRPDNVEKYEQIAYSKKAQNEVLKKKILTSLYEELEEPTEDKIIKLNKEKLKKENSNNEEQNSIKNKKRMKNKKQNIIESETNEEEKQIENQEMEATLGDMDENESNSNQKQEKKKNKKGTKKQKRKKNTDHHDIIESEINEEKVKQIEDQEMETTLGDKNGIESNLDQKQKKKKHKKQTNNNLEQGDITQTSTEINESMPADLTTKHNGKNPKETTNKNKKKKKKKTGENLDAISLSNQNETTNTKPDGKLSRRQKKNLKKATLKTSEPPKTNEETVDAKKKQNKQKRKPSESQNNNDGQASPKKKFKKSNNLNKTKDSNDDLNLTNSRLKAYGFNPKKFKNKLKYKKPVTNKS